ncbi:MAG: SGNH/GDSL hydrolase family protein [Glaciecola sp.]
MKRWSTVQDFIANGKLPPDETVASFEGFASKGDGGASLWLGTGDTGTPSQAPIQRGDNLLTDTTGAVFKPQLGSVFYFDGTNQWFPSPFGDNGNGLYQYNGAGWNYYEQAGGAVSIAVTTGLITNTFNYDVGTVLSFTGYSSPGDGGGAKWIKTSSTGSQSQSPTLRGDGTLTDATGAVWKIVETARTITFRGGDGFSAVENMIAGRFGGSEVITLSGGDICMADGLMWRYIGGSSGIDNFVNIFTPFYGYSQYNGGQLSELYEKLNNPLQQKLGITFVGDSITWGTGASGQSESGTRDKTLSDPRNNFSSASWVNEFKRWVLDYIGGGATFSLSNHPFSPSGESIININKEVAIFPIGNDFSVQTSGAATDTIGTGLDGLLNGRRDLALNDTGTASLFFRMTGDSFTLVYAQYPEGASYEVIIEGQSLGVFDTAGVASFSVERQHTFNYINDSLVEIKAFVDGGVGNEQLRVEAIKVNRDIAIKNQGIIGITTKIMNAWNYPSTEGPYVTYSVPTELSGYAQTASATGSTSYSELENQSALLGFQYSYFANADGFWDINFDANGKDSLSIVFSALNSGADVEVYADEVLVSEFSTSTLSGQVQTGFSKTQLISLPPATVSVRLRVKHVDYGGSINVKSLRLEAISLYNASEVEYPTNNSFGDGVALEGTDDFVFYQLGTNDRGEGDISSPSFMLDNIDKMIRKHPVGAKPVIMVANPAEVESGDFKMQDVLSNLSRFSKDRGIDFIDNYSIFDGLDTSFTTSDGLHPNDYGHSLIAKNIIYAIKNSR